LVTLTRKTANPILELQRASYNPALLIFAPQLGHAISLCSYPQFMQKYLTLIWLSSFETEILDLNNSLIFFNSKPEDLGSPEGTPETMNNQKNAAFAWTATNWSGACDELAKVAKPTLVITGTEDNDYVPHGNALIIAGKIPGAWLVQIKDAGHAVPTQYPEELGRIVNTFLSTVPNN
jgi:pimeloyl-ACP methyl ester carboxylesterase